MEYADAHGASGRAAIRSKLSIAAPASHKNSGSNEGPRDVPVGPARSNVPFFLLQATKIRSALSEFFTSVTLQASPPMVYWLASARGFTRQPVPCRATCA